MTPPIRRIIILRANRDTLVLIACTIGITLALASVRQQRADRPEQPAGQPAQQVWAGQLADIAPPEAGPAKPEPMTSESLVVPKATLALPPLQPPPRGAGKPTCDATPCLAKAAAPLPPARQKLAAADPMGSPRPTAEPSRSAEKKRERRFELSDLNPLHHIPDAVRRPFSYAGSKVSGWIDWF